MPAIINYATVLQRMTGQGYRSLYHNSGAFGFAPQLAPIIIGWSLRDDPTIRSEARPLVQQVNPPQAQTLAELAMRFWRGHTPGPVWIMPMSHWSFELDHGSAAWMPAALQRIEIDPRLLSARADGAAIDFAREEWPSFRAFVSDLLSNLTASDFMAAFPGLPILCTIHHHQQLWWQTTDVRLADVLRELPAEIRELNQE